LLHELEASFSEQVEGDLTGSLAHHRFTFLVEFKRLDAFEPELQARSEGLADLEEVLSDGGANCLSGAFEIDDLETSYQVGIASHRKFQRILAMQQLESAVSNQKHVPTENAEQKR
jgi:hypothetical protein